MSDDSWRGKFEAYLKKHGLRLTHQRSVIGEIFFDSDGHLSFEELYDQVRQRDSAIGQATIYRTLRLFVESGLASSSRFGGAAARYEPSHDDEHHDHLICINCGRIVEFFDEEIERRQEEIAEAHGLKLVDHKMELYAACMPKCVEGAEGS